MNRAIRSVFAVFLAAIMMVAFIPYISANGTANADEEKINVWVGGIQVTAENASDIDGTGSASYDIETNTLTLDDYHYSGPGIKVVSPYETEIRAAIVSFGQLNIVTKGTAVINLTNPSGLESANLVAGIAALDHHSGVGELYFTGGKVTAKASSPDSDSTVCGVYAETRMGTASMTLTAKAANKDAVADSIGIVIGCGSKNVDGEYGLTTLKSTINASGGLARDDNANYESIGILAFDDLCIDNNTTLNVNNSSGGSTIGIECDGAGIEIGVARVSVNGGQATGEYGVSVGISSQYIDITEDYAYLKVVGGHAFMGACPEFTGSGNINALISDNLDGSEGGDLYFKGNYAPSSAMYESIINNARYFEMKHGSFDGWDSVDIQIVDNVREYPYVGKPVCPEVIVKIGDKVLVEGEDYRVEYTNNNAPGTGTIRVISLKSSDSTHVTFTIYASSGLPERIAGATRYDTGLEAANKLLELKETDEFDNIIIAYGGNFPDALTGSYLAKVKNAPIILVDKARESMVAEYAKSHLKYGGKVYILGDTAVVSSNFEKSLKDDGVAVKRLAGATRYQTNIKILKAAGVTNQELLICTGNGYADSLSASATGRPILLVNKTLTAEQKAFLADLDTDKFYVLGGSDVVSDSVMNQVAKALPDASKERIAGATRYQTSTLIAKKFFSNPSSVVLAYGKNFPDGLSGGPLALQLNAPLILVANSNFKDAKTLCQKNKTSRVLVLGDNTLISDPVAASMFRTDMPTV
ncbi:MAG: cell wall-binding repeat-containing protein [Firmicutes bacterium]|nr:cell wall-binding repeat-containing protein [Bacillota bacterium]